MKTLPILTVATICLSGCHPKQPADAIGKNSRGQWMTLADLDPCGTNGGCPGTNASPLMPPPYPPGSLQLRAVLNGSELDIHATNTIPNNQYQWQVSTDLIEWATVTSKVTNTVGSELSFAFFQLNSNAFARLQDVTTNWVYGPVNTNASSGGCEGAYTGLVNYGLHAVDHGTVVHMVSDGTGRADTIIAWVGGNSDHGCATNTWWLTNPPSSSYVWKLYFPSNNPATSSYPVIVRGFD